MQVLRAHARDGKQAPLAVRLLHDSLLWRALFEPWLAKHVDPFVELLCNIVALAAEYRMLVRF